MAGGEKRGQYGSGAQLAAAAAAAAELTERSVGRRCGRGRWQSERPRI